ncbi:MAG: porin [Alphaproteobacteria bacterium]|nr:porin [Alphaproteobacteria bacterium]
MKIKHVLFASLCMAALTQAHAKNHKKSADVPAVPVVQAPAEAVKDDTPEGYLKVTNNTFIGIHGYVHGVFNYDIDTFGGDYQQANVFAWEKLNDTPGAHAEVNSPNKKGIFSAHMKQTRLGIHGLTRSARYGDIKGTVVTDFYGDDRFATSAQGDNNQGYRFNDPQIGGSLRLRMRQAFLEVNGWRIGQDFSVFNSFPDAEMVDFVGHYGDSTRLPQLRYTWKINDNVTWVNSVERPATDYISFNSAGADADAKNVRSYRTTDSSDRVVHRIPDLATRVNFSPDTGYMFGLRAAMHHVCLKEQDRHSGRRQSKTGYALGVDAKIDTVSGGYFSTVLNYSNGANQHIAEFNGLSAVLDTATHSLKLQKTIQWGFGLTQPFSDEWAMNIGYARGMVQKAKNLETGLVYNVNGNANTVTRDNANRVPTRSIERYFANLMWSPTAELKFGLEYAHAVRRGMKDSSLTTSLKATGKRLLASARYSF